MFWSPTYSSLKELETAPSASYGQQVRAAHALADLLKRTHPHLHDQICELQSQVTHDQQLLADIQRKQQDISAGSKLEGKPISQTLVDALTTQRRSALQDLDQTMQTLLDLRHKGSMAR